MAEPGPLTPQPPALPAGLVRHTTRYLGATYLSTLLCAVRSIINARWLGPELYGFWGSLAFFMSFGYHLHGGVREAVIKDIPAYRAQGRADLAADAAQLAFTFFASLLLIAAAGFWVAAWRLPAQTPALLRWGWVVAGVVLVLEVLYDFEQTVTRAEERFDHLNAALTFATVASLLLTVWLVVAYGLAGFYWVAVATPALGLWLLRRRAGYRWRWRWSWPRLREMLATGWPVLGMVLVFEALRWIDRGLILGLIGLEGLGCYTLGLMLMRLCFFFPEVIASVVEPRLHADYTRSNDAADIRDHLWLPLRTLALLMPCGLAALDVVLPFVLAHWLPAYRPGLPAIRVLVWSSVFMGMAFATKSALVALGQQRRVLPIYGAAIAVSLAGGLWLVQRGWGLTGVACSTGMAYAVCSTGLVVVVLRQLGWSWRTTLQRLGWLYLPTAAMASLTAGLPALVRHVRPGLASPELSVLLGVVALGYGVVALRRVGLTMRLPSGGLGT
jgi:O-antigen/teichoic acid export membrane protein